MRLGSLVLLVWMVGESASGQSVNVADDLGDRRPCPRLDLIARKDRVAEQHAGDRDCMSERPAEVGDTNASPPGVRDRGVQHRAAYSMPESAGEIFEISFRTASVCSMDAEMSEP